MMEEVSRWKQRMGERGLDPLRGPRSTKKNTLGGQGETRQWNGTCLLPRPRRSVRVRACAGRVQCVWTGGLPAVSGG
jgi:hypothetical protein